MSQLLFDAYCMVDWSANSTPKAGKDSIWIGTAVLDGGRLALGGSRNPSTRAEAERLVGDWLAEQVAQGSRVLVGFDFPYGYPSGTAHALGLGAPPWRSTWTLIHDLLRDEPDNRNNRWQVAATLNQRIGARQLWGCPRSQENSWLSAKRSEAPLPRLRATELRVGGTIQSAWKLCYPGSVGSQALTGIPALHRLREDPRLRARSRIWPFETGFTPDPRVDGSLIVHAEIWPQIPQVKARVMARADAKQAVLDRMQVEEMCRWCAEEDEGGRLARYFDRPVGAAADHRSVVEEEGWILGV